MQSKFSSTPLLAGLTLLAALGPIKPTRLWDFSQTAPVAGWGWVDSLSTKRGHHESRMSASDLSSIYVRKGRFSFTGQLFDHVYHGAVLPSTYVDDLERLQDVVNHWCGIEASFSIRFRFRFLLWGFEPFELAMMPSWFTSSTRHQKWTWIGRISIKSTGRTAGGNGPSFLPWR